MLEPSLSLQELRGGCARLESELMHATWMGCGAAPANATSDAATAAAGVIVKTDADEDGVKEGSNAV